MGNLAKSNEPPHQQEASSQNKTTNQNYGKVPTIVKEEINTIQYLGQIGEAHYNHSQASRRTKKQYSLISPTRIELESEETKGLMQYFQVKINPLGLTTIAKVIILYVVASLGMAAEFFIYQSIAENAFGMPLTKSYFMGFVVVLFTKFIQVAISPYIKVWIKESNILLRSLHKLVIFLFVGLIFINAMMLGITNLNQINSMKKIQQLEYASTSIAEAEEYGEDTTELENELSTLQTELNKGDSGFIKLIRFLSIVLIGLLTIGCGATLFCIADLYSDALRLKKKIKKLKDQLAKHRANFQYFLTTYTDMLSLQKEIIKLHGQKHFLEKLLSTQREEELKIPQE